MGGHDRETENPHEKTDQAEKSHGERPSAVRSKARATSDRSKKPMENTVSPLNGLLFVARAEHCNSYR
jgi:hypothetical protein